MRLPALLLLCAAVALAPVAALAQTGYPQQGVPDYNAQGGMGFGGTQLLPGPAGGPTDRPAALLDPSRKLQQGDLLSIKIEQDKEPAIPLTVSATGEVVVEPLESAVRIAGLTLSQATAEIKRRLEKDYYYTATVRLTLERPNLQATMGYVFISGAVMRVGAIPVYAEQPMKLSEAILTAGGFAKFADDRRVRVTRPNPGGGNPQVFKCDIKEVLQRGRTEYDFMVQAGDQVFVPETFMKR